MPNDKPAQNTKTTKRKRPLKQIRRKFAHLLAEGKPVCEAAPEAGYSASVTKSRAYEIAAELSESGEIEDIRQRNRLIFKNLEFDTDKRFGKILALTEAKRVISAVSGNAADGKTVDFIDVPDNQVQLAATKEALKLAGDYPEDRVQLDTGPGFESLLSSAREAKGKAIERQRAIIVDAEVVQSD